MTWTSVHKWLKIGPAFLPTLRICILIHCQGLQTIRFCHLVTQQQHLRFVQFTILALYEFLCMYVCTKISRWNSTKLCQMVDSKLCLQCAVEKLGSSQKLGTKKLYICSVFWRLQELMANVFWMTRDIDNQARVLESTNSLLHHL